MCETIQYFNQGFPQWRNLWVHKSLGPSNLSESSDQHAEWQYKEPVILEIMASPYLDSGDFPVGRALQTVDNGLLQLATGTENHTLSGFCIIWMCFNGYDFI